MALVYSTILGLDDQARLKTVSLTMRSGNLVIHQCLVRELFTYSSTKICSNTKRFVVESATEFSIA